MVRTYTCALCGNHGLRISKKNHKFCANKNCPCGECEVTRNCQEALKKSIAIRRSKAIRQTNRKNRRISKDSDNSQVFDEFQSVINEPDTQYDKFVHQMYFDMRNDILSAFYKIMKSCNGDGELASERAQKWVRDGTKDSELNVQNIVEELMSIEENSNSSQFDQTNAIYILNPFPEYENYELRYENL